MSIAEARAAEVNTRLRIRGVVILPSGLLDEATAAVADASGAILVRIGSEAGTLARGQLVELNGTRSTKSGMLTLRISVPATVLGSQAEPDGARRATGAVGETDEATLVIVRGVVADGPRKSTSGGLSFTVNDGSGPLRVFVSAATRIQATDVPPGAWIEVQGVVGQETTGAQPRTGYRLWPRDTADLQVVAAATRTGGSLTGSTGSGSGAASEPPDRTPGGPSGSLAALRRPILRTKDDVATPTSSPSPSALPSAVEGRVAAASRLAVPLAAGVGSLAGLAVLGWRRGTWHRLRDEVEALATPWPLSRRGDGDREGESYTPPP